MTRDERPDRPSDEEIRKWLKHEGLILQEFDYDDGIAMTREALAKWGQPAPYDAAQVEALIERATQAVADLRASGYVITAAELDGAIINLRASRQVERRVESVRAVIAKHGIEGIRSSKDEIERVARGVTACSDDAAREEEEG